MDTSHNRVSVAADNSLGRDNLFSKTVVSNLYESYHFQSSLLQDQRVYDSQYKLGFPKLYSFDTSVEGRSKISDKSNKFSFKTQRQQCMMTNYSAIMQENRQLRHQLQFMGSQNRRIIGILQGKETEWHRLNSQIEYLKRNPKTVTTFEHNGCIWEMKYTEMQTKLNELNSVIENNSLTVIGLRQQIVQLQSRQTSLRSQISQMHSELNLSLRNVSKLEQELFQATSKVKKYERMSNGKRQGSSQTQQQTQVLVYEQKIEQAGRQIDGYKVRVRQYERQIALYQEKIKEYQSKIFTLEEKSHQLSEIKQRDGHMVEIVRELEQRERQHIQKASELHKYLKKAQSYIEQLHSQLQSLSQQKTQNNQSQPIIDNLTQQVSELTQRIRLIESQKRQKQDQTEQLERLNMKVKELRDYLTKAQNYIEQLQEILRQHQELKVETVVEYRVPEDVLQRLSRLQVVQRECETFDQEKEQFMREKCQIQELIERLRVENQMLKRQNQVLREQRQQMEKRIAGTQRIQELLALKQTLVEQNARIKRQIGDRESQEIGRLTQEIYRLNGETAQLRNQVTILQQENVSLAELNRKLSTQIAQGANKMAQIPQSAIQKTAQISQSEIQSQLARLRLQSVILLQQINRLNYCLNQVTSFLLNAQTYITQVQTRLQQVSTAHFESVSTQARLRLQCMILLQEINRVNQVIRQSHQHLVDAENYIEQCELQIRNYRQDQTRIVYQVPPEVQQKISLLAVQNQRISSIVRQYQETGRKQVESIREAQAKELTQMRRQLHQAQNSNLILREQLQNALHKAQYHQQLYTSLKQQQSVNSYEQQCQQLRQHLITAQNHIQNLQTYISQLQSRLNQGQDHTQEEKYQKQIMELKQRIRQMQSFNQVQISTYQEQVAQYNLQIVQLSQSITSLTQQVSNYRTQITMLKTQSNSIKSQFSTLQSQIQGYIQQISKQNLQLSNYQQRINSLEHQASQAGHPQNLQSENLQCQLAQQHLKSIILLQQINRLNHKLIQLTAENRQLVNHLVTAQDHITRIEYQLQEQLRQKTVQRQGQTMVQSAEVSKQLIAQLSRLEYSSQVQISARDLRIVFLLEQINRLNHKERQLLSIIDLGGSQTSKFLSANHQIAILRQQKLKYEQQLAAVLQHLKYAQDYITQLLHQNQNFVHERQLLITQLSNIYPKK